MNSDILGYSILQTKLKRSKDHQTATILLRLQEQFAMKPVSIRNGDFSWQTLKSIVDHEFHFKVLW